MDKTVTIIIPTHERSQVIDRAIAYYKNLSYNLIICDSSKESNQIAIYKDKITYLHLPDSSFGAKILESLNRVETDYVCLSADDDFLAETGLLSAFDFLERNKDYVSANGVYTQFTFLGSHRVIFNQLYQTSKNHRFEVENMKERVKSSMVTTPLLYSLFRKEALTEAIKLSLSAPKTTNVEIACNMVPLMFGKHKTIPVFWMARDTRRYTQYNLSVNDTNTVINDYKQYLKTEEGINFQNSFVSLYHSVSGDSKENGSSLFSDVFNNYFQNQTLKSSKKPVWKNYLRKVIPESFIYFRRKGIMDRLKIGDQLISKNQDWIRIKQIICKFGFLEEKIDERV